MEEWETFWPHVRTMERTDAVASASPARRGVLGRYHSSVLLLEFTIEPFTEGNPGPHVRAAVDAAEALGVEVEFGPFGSSCTVAQSQLHEVSGAVIAAAFAHGATHVNLHVEQLGDSL